MEQAAVQSKTTEEDRLKVPPPTEPTARGTNLFADHSAGGVDPSDSALGNSVLKVMIGETEKATGSDDGQHSSVTEYNLANH